MRKGIILISISLLVVSNVLAQEIRVKVGSFERIYFSSPATYKIIQKENENILYQGRDLKSASVSKGNIEIYDLGTYRNALIIEPDSESFIKINKRRYRGKIELHISENRVKAINVINIEEYLYGVVGGEMPSDWHINALKAQAIISRTFALGNLNKHKNEDCNLCDSWHCQIYGGINYEDPEVKKAVDGTKGQVVAYGDAFIHAPFHASCGGMTAKSNLVWNGGGKYPYLRTVIDPFCRNSPHQRWERIVSEDIIRKKLLKKNIGKMYSITPLNKGRDGRAKDILIRHSEGELTLSSNDFRLALDPTIIKSTRFTVVKKGDDFIFSGCGWGHGVGLCQWGAKAMADSGKNYTQILRFYYPGTTIKDINY